MKFKNVESLPFRPDFARKNVIDLTGSWDFEFDDEKIGLKQKWYKSHIWTSKINVPFVYQSKASGIDVQEKHEIVWYEKLFSLSKAHMGKEVLLCFGAVDYSCTVYLNGELVGAHTGGYSSFKLNITNNINYDSENKITLRVSDSVYDSGIVRGKQSWIEKPFKCWYTNYTGIWQPVWLEISEKILIDRFRITPDIDNHKIDIAMYVNPNAVGKQLVTTIKAEGKAVTTLSMLVTSSSFTFSVDIFNSEFEYGVMLWDVLKPFLYDIEFSVIEGDKELDVVTSYFGMRKISVRQDKIYINNRFLYQKLILNQGYYPKGLISPSNIKVFQDDIEAIIAMGFNGMRIHQKIEDPRLLYLCDYYGIIVWEELPSYYDFKKVDIKNLSNEWLEVIDRDYNHPSIITYVVFNESWGVRNIYENIDQQNLVQAMYHLTKSYDNTRLVIDNDGWEHTTTDICSIHDYEGNAVALHEQYKNQYDAFAGSTSDRNPRQIYCPGFEYCGEPVMINEYGGIAFQSDQGWGYNDKVATEEAFIERYRALTNAIKELKYVTGYCYTQLTDVEIEDNGLLTFDRKPKVNIEAIKEINDSIGFKQDFGKYEGM